MSGARPLATSPAKPEAAARCGGFVNDQEPVKSNAPSMQLPKNIRLKVTNNGGDDDYRDGGIRYFKSVEFDIVEETRVIGAGRLFRINTDLA